MFPSDYELVERLRKGDVEAFDLIYEKYSGKLYAFGLKYLRSTAEAEDLVQSVFLKIWENYRNLKKESSFKSYLFTIALNQIRKHFNKRAISLHYLESLQNDLETEDNQTILNDDYESILQQINIIIEQMPPRRREIFMKSKIEGKSSKEIATELNISTGTVDNQVSEALRFIRSHLNNENLGLLLFAFLFVY